MDEALEERVAKVEGILGQMDKRLGRVEAELKELREETRVEIRGLREEMKEGFQRIDDRFFSFTKWIMVAMIGSWATLMGAIIALMVVLR